MCSVAGLRLLNSGTIHMPSMHTYMIQQLQQPYSIRFLHQNIGSRVPFRPLSPSPIMAYVSRALPAITTQCTTLELVGAYVMAAWTNSSHVLNGAGACATLSTVYYAQLPYTTTNHLNYHPTFPGFGKLSDFSFLPYNHNIQQLAHFDI